MYHNSLNLSAIAGYLGGFQNFIIILLDILVVRVGQASAANRPKL